MNKSQTHERNGSFKTHTRFEFRKRIGGGKKLKTNNFQFPVAISKCKMVDINQASVLNGKRFLSISPIIQNHSAHVYSHIINENGDIGEKGLLYACSEIYGVYKSLLLLFLFRI